MTTFAKTMMTATMALVGAATAHAAGPMDFGPRPGAFVGNGAACVGGNCPTGDCRNGECGLGGCANGTCTTGNRYGQYGHQGQYGYQPMTTQGTRAGYAPTVGNAAFYGTGSPSNCPGGICPPTPHTHTTGYGPRAPVAGCTTGNCPTPGPRYPMYQQPRFSFLGLRF
jgi:hypothetical protein